MREWNPRYSTVIVLSALLFLGTSVVQRVGLEAAARTLDIYFIDVEGGQSTLVITPAGESLLIDAGFPGNGTFESRPGDGKNARDAPRILAAARAAGINRIDYLLITHFHADHAGGVVELARDVPIGTFIDHGGVPAAAEANVPGTLEMFERYTALRLRGRHIEPKPGDRLPLKDVDAIVVSSGGATIGEPLSNLTRRSVPGCASTPLAAQEAVENPRSTGVWLRFGRFRFLDVGDLTGPPLRAL